LDAKNSTTSFFQGLGIRDGIAVSVAGMAPTLAMNLNPQEPASHVGHLVPLVFAICTLLLLLVAWCFAHLSRRHPNAGSAYGFVSTVIGPRTGLIAGWALFGTYLAFVMCSIGAFGLFRSNMAARMQVPDHASTLEFTLVGALVIGALCITSTRRAGLALILLEGIAVVSMVILSCSVLWHVFQGRGPRVDPPLHDLFLPTDGVGASAFALALSFGFLSFAGFEEVATLGEEITSPKKTIPRVLIGTILGAGLVFTLVTAAQVLGFGTDPSGMSRLTHSSSLLGDLGTLYFGTACGDLMDILAIFSALGGALASVVAASRILFALSRDLTPSSPLGRVALTTGTPMNASLLVIAISFLGYITMRSIFHGSGSDAFFWGSTLGALSLLVAYFLVVLSAAISFIRNRGEENRFKILIPLIAGISILYTFWVNVYPVQSGAYGVIPAIVICWCLLPILLLLIKPDTVSLIRSGFLQNKTATTSSDNATES
jgi:amino acid transporter